MAGDPLDEAYEVGRRYEAGLDSAARRQGAHFTPPAVAERLVDRSLRAWRGPRAPRVCDPCAGGGVFLVAAAEALRRSGVAPRTVLEVHVTGGDVDRGAVAAATSALRAWGAVHGVHDVEPRVLLLDACAPEAARRYGELDVVVGNPPFRAQLGGATARSATRREESTRRFGGLVGGYADDSAMFVLAALDLLGPGGVLAQVLPRSFLVARDTTPVRERLVQVGAPVEVWIPGSSVFAASVDVCSLVLEVGGRPGPVEVRSGGDADVDHGTFDAARLVGAPTWSPLWALAQRIPAPPEAGPSTIAGLAVATAGFRDQYYGLLDHLSEDRPVEGAHLVTTAHVDPGRCGWGERPVTVARRRWDHPWVDVAGVRSSAAGLGPWLDRIRVPKVLVATQTRIIEAVADPAGSDVPLTPLISVVPSRPDDVHLVTAALLAPAATVWALHRFGGGALSSGALKLSAAQVTGIPAPVDRATWLDGAAALAAGDVDWPRFARTMNRAWAVVDDELAEWWWARHPANPAARPRRKSRGSDARSLH